MIKITKRILLPYIYLAFCLVTTIASCCVFSAQTLDYRLDRYYYSLNNYNTQTRLDKYEPPVLKCRSVEALNAQTQLDALISSYETFYYNIMDQCCWLEIPNETTVDCFGVSKPLRLLTQPRFWITDNQTNSERYFLEYGQYLTYFDLSVITNGSMFSPRYGADAFIFISDVFADELVTGYNIAPENAYETLINDPVYSLITIDNGAGVSFVASINNIVDSNYKKGPLTVDFYGNTFGLIGINGAMDKLLDLSLSILLKTNPYNFKTIVQTTLNLLGDEAEHFTFEIFDRQSESYSLNSAKTEELNAILQKKNRDMFFRILYYLVLIVGVICYAVIFYKIVKRVSRKEALCLAGIIFGCFIIYGLIANFLYVYPWFSVSPLLMSVATLPVFIKKSVLSTKLLTDQRVPFDEINI